MESEKSAPGGGFVFSGKLPRGVEFQRCSKPFTQGGDASHSKTSARGVNLGLDLGTPFSANSPRGVETGRLYVALTRGGGQNFSAKVPPPLGIIMTLRVTLLPSAPRMDTHTSTLIIGIEETVAI